MQDSINLWGPIDMNKWEHVPFIKSQIATEEDVVIGRAVFFINKEQCHIHYPMEIDIPSLVYQINDETGKKELALIIQGEKVDEQVVIGLRYLDGGNGVCSLEELEFINK